MADINWTRVYVEQDMFRADIVRNTLIEHGIQAIVLNKRDTSYNDFGDVEVYVDQTQVVGAIKIIEDEIHFE